MGDVHENVRTCLACRRECAKCKLAPVPSGVVMTCHISGLPLMASHVEPNDCPLGRFAARGLGDVVAKVIGFVWKAKAPCGGCAARRKKLNEMFPA